MADVAAAEMDAAGAEKPVAAGAKKSAAADDGDDAGEAYEGDGLSTEEELDLDAPLSSEEEIAAAAAAVLKKAKAAALKAKRDVAAAARAAAAAKEAAFAAEDAEAATDMAFVEPVERHIKALKQTLKDADGYTEKRTGPLTRPRLYCVRFV